MVSTIKMSAFADANLNNQTNQMAGISSSTGGINVKSPFTNTWTTVGRPATPYNGLIGLNTDLQEYEFWNAVAGMWSQLGSSTNTFLWHNVTTLTQSMVSNNGYVANNAGQVVLTLPPTANFGEIIKISGYGSGGWSLVFNAGQNAILGRAVATTSTGSISSTNQYDQIELLCVVANTTFIALTSFGNLTII